MKILNFTKEKISDQNSKFVPPSKTKKFGLLVALIICLGALAFSLSYAKNYQLVKNYYTNLNLQSSPAQFIYIEFTKSDGKIQLSQAKLTDQKPNAQLKKPDKGYWITVVKNKQIRYETYLLDEQTSPLATNISAEPDSKIIVKDIESSKSLLNLNTSQVVSAAVDETQPQAAQIQRNIPKEAFKITLRSFFGLGSKPNAQDELNPKNSSTQPPDIENLSTLVPVDEDFMHISYDKSVDRFIVFIYKSPFNEGKKQAVQWFGDQGFSDLCALNLEFRTEIEAKTPLLTPEEKSAPGCTP